MTIDALKQKLKTDRVARMKYIESAIDFFESNGVVVDDTLLKSFDEDANKTVTGGGGGGTNVLAIF